MCLRVDGAGKRAELDLHILLLAGGASSEVRRRCTTCRLETDANKESVWRQQAQRRLLLITRHTINVSGTIGAHADRARASLACVLCLVQAALRNVEQHSIAVFALE